MDHLAAARFAAFLKDEQPALAELRDFVGGDAGVLLNASRESLALLDAFLDNLLADSGWASSPLFAAAPRARPWLTVRVAYYIGACAARLYGSQWYMSKSFGSP